MAAPAGSADAQKPELDAKRAEEMRALLAGVPPLEVPWQLLESSVSAARIRALAKMLDPSSEMDDGAVKVRGGRRGGPLLCRGHAAEFA